MSLTFDKDGYCTRITSWAVLDPTIGNAGGLGGPEGYQYAMGQASLGVFTRPLPRALGRVRRRLLSPVTGVDVDDYTTNALTRYSGNGNIPSVVGRVNGSAKFATPVRPTVPPPASATTRGSIAPPDALDDAVLTRLERFKDAASSIRINPPDISKSFPLLPDMSKSFPLLSDISKSFPLLPSLSGRDETGVSTREPRRTEVARSKEAERGPRDSARLSQQRAAAQATALLVQKQAQQDTLERQRKEVAEAQRRQAQQVEAQRQRQENKRQQAAATATKQAEARRRIELEKERAIEAQQREQQAKVRRDAVAAAAAQAKRAEMAARERQQEIEQSRRQAEQKRIAATKAKQAEADRANKAALAAREASEWKRREAEALRIAAVAAAESKKLQLAREQADQRAMAAKAKLADVANTVAKRNKLGSKVSAAPAVPASQSGFSVPSFGATISLFGLGKRDLDDLPDAKSTPSTKKAPPGVPTLKRWRKNVDMTLSGLVFGSRSFDDNSRITTSPIASGSISSGQVVKTGSGTRYFLE